MDELEVIRIVARAYNNLDCSEIAAIASDDIVYASQEVRSSLNGKDKVLDLLRGKFKSIKESNFLAFAEIGILGSQRDSKIQIWLPIGTPCVILSQGRKEDKVGLAFVKTEEDKITRINFCSVAPHWSQAKGTGEFPK